MRSALACLSVVLLGLAGCADGDAGAGPVVPRTYPWGVSECAFVIARVPVAVDALAPYLPVGFQPTTDATTGLGELHLDAYACDGGVGLAGENLTAVAYGSYYVPVVAPEALREEGYDAYFVKLDFLDSEPGRREVLEDGGFPVHAGHVAVTGSGSRWHAELSMADGSEGFVLDGVAGGAEPSGSLPFIEYTPLSSGALARWHARLHDAQIAQATGILQPRGLARQVIGADAVPAQFIAGTWNLDEADVTFPVEWP